MVYFLTGAVAGSRRTPGRHKTGGVPPKPPATIFLSVTLGVLGLRFVLPQSVAASFWPAAAAAAISIIPDVAASIAASRRGSGCVQLRRRYNFPRAGCCGSGSLRPKKRCGVPVRRRGKPGVFLNGFDFEYWRGAERPTSAGLVRSCQTGWGCFRSVSRHGVWCSYRHGAERPTSKGLVRSHWRATDPRTGNIESCVLASGWPRASHSSSPVGGMSGHTLGSSVVLVRACWWLSLVWLGAGASGGCAPGAGASRWLVGFGFSFSVALREGADPRTGFLFLSIPFDVLRLRFLASSAKGRRASWLCAS